MKKSTRKREHWGSKIGFIMAAAGSAVGLGSGATIFALILLLLGVVTLGLANSKIRGHVHSFAKEKVGGKFKSKTKDPGFSDQEWEEYFKRLKED